MIVRTVEELYDLPDDTALLGADGKVSTSHLLRFEDSHDEDIDDVFPATVLIPSTISPENFEEMVFIIRDQLDPPGISDTQHLTTKYVERIAGLVLHGVGIEITE